MERIPVPVVHVGNCYTNGATVEPLIPTPNENFLRLLTHENYTIQIPRLKKAVKSQVIRVLNVFNQEYKTNDSHKLNYTGDSEDPLILKMLARLTRAAADDELRKKMDLEDEMERTYNKHLNDLQHKLDLKDKELAEKDNALQEKDNALQEKDNALQEKDTALQEKNKELAEKDNALREEKKHIEQLLKELEVLKGR